MKENQEIVLVFLFYCQMFLFLNQIKLIKKTEPGTTSVKQNKIAKDLIKEKV